MKLPLAGGDVLVQAQAFIMMTRKIPGRLGYGANHRGFNLAGARCPPMRRIKAARAAGGDARMGRWRRTRGPHSAARDHA